MAVTGICELTLETSDLEGVERFYREAFGLPVLAREGDRVWLGVGGQTRLGLWTPGAKEFGDEGGRHVHFAFRADAGTLDALAERVRALGCAVRGPERREDGDSSLYVEDPEGNVVEIWDFFDRGKGARDGVRALSEA